MSSPINKAEAERIARRALEELGTEWSHGKFHEASGHFDLFAAVDSFALVELILRTEAIIESERGRYIPLADEKIMDAQETPLRSIDRWIDHVAQAMAHG